MVFPFEVMGSGMPAAEAKHLGGRGATIVATGSTQTDAALVGTNANMPLGSLCIVTGADGTKGVLLPAIEQGASCQLFNSSVSALKVWPPVGAAISVSGTGLGTANAFFSLAANTSCLFVVQSATQYLSNKGA